MIIILQISQKSPCSSRLTVLPPPLAEVQWRVVLKTLLLCEFAVLVKSASDLQDCETSGIF